MGAGVSANHGYNIGLELTNCYAKYFDHREVELNGLIDKLKLNNLQIKILGDLMNKLTHAKADDKQADFTNDELAKKLAYLVHLSNPTILDDKIKGIPEDGGTLEQKLQEVIGQLKDQGYPDDEIDLNLILDNINVSGISLDILAKDDIDIIIQGLDAETKMRSADLNEVMMNINSKYEDRSQMTENARQVLKTASDHIESIIRRAGQR